MRHHKSHHIINSWIGALIIVAALLLLSSPDFSPLRTGRAVGPTVKTYGVSWTAELPAGSNSWIYNGSFTATDGRGLSAFQPVNITVIRSSGGSPPPPAASPPTASPAPHTGHPMPAPAPSPTPPSYGGGGGSGGSTPPPTPAPHMGVHYGPSGTIIVPAPTPLPQSSQPMVHPMAGPRTLTFLDFLNIFSQPEAAPEEAPAVKIKLSNAARRGGHTNFSVFMRVVDKKLGAAIASATRSSDISGNLYLPQNIDAALKTNPQSSLIIWPAGYLQKNIDANRTDEVIRFRPGNFSSRPAEKLTFSDVLFTLDYYLNGNTNNPALKAAYPHRPGFLSVLWMFISYLLGIG